MIDTEDLKIIKVTNKSCPYQCFKGTYETTHVVHEFDFFINEKSVKIFNFDTYSLDNGKKLPKRDKTFLEEFLQTNFEKFTIFQN